MATKWLRGRSTCQRRGSHHDNSRGKMNSCRREVGQGRKSAMMRTCLILALAGFWGWSAALAQQQRVPVQVEACAPCHGNDGIARDVEVPHLAGQNVVYLFNQLRAFRSGQRKHKEMQYMSRSLTQDEMEALAEYFASLLPIPTKPPVYNGMIAPRDSWMMPPPCNEMIPPGAPRCWPRKFFPSGVSGQAVLDCLPRVRRRLSPVSSMRCALCTRRSRMASA